MDRHRTLLIRESWARLAPEAPIISDLFYRLVSQRAPQLRLLFPDNPTRQRLAFMQMVLTITEGIDDMAAVAAVLAATGQRHGAYTTRPEHYRIVGECLLTALADVGGPRFTDEVSDAWADAYRLVARIMLDATLEAVSQFDVERAALGGVAES